MYAVYALLKVHCHSFHKTTVLLLSWKLVKSCSLFMFVLRILQGCALIGIISVLSTHRTIACGDMYCVPTMLFVYIVCICGLLIVYHVLFSTSTDHETRLLI